MRWQKKDPHINNFTRIRKIFLFYPLSFDRVNYRWLEWANVEERYYKYLNARGGFWLKEKFID